MADLSSRPLAEVQRRVAEVHHQRDLQQQLRFYNGWAKDYDQHGIQLQAKGFRHFHGLDGSQEMLEHARHKGLYEDLKLCLLGQETLPAPEDSYDTTVIVGALSEGQVPSGVIPQLLLVTKPVMGIFIFLMGAQCTRCIEDEPTKAKITIVSGVIFLLTGILTLIPVSWSANQIIRDFYNPAVPPALKREIGPSLYIGWAAAALFLFGGSLLCCSCPPKEEKYRPTPMVYSAPRSTALSYDKKNYV